MVRLGWNVELSGWQDLKKNSSGLVQKYFVKRQIFHRFFGLLSQLIDPKSIYSGLNEPIRIEQKSNLHKCSKLIWKWVNDLSFCVGSTLFVYIGFQPPPSDVKKNLASHILEHPCVVNYHIASLKRRSDMSFCRVINRYNFEAKKMEFNKIL